MYQGCDNQIFIVFRNLTIGICSRLHDGARDGHRMGKARDPSAFVDVTGVTDGRILGGQINTFR